MLPSLPLSTTHTPQLLFCHNPLLSESLMSNCYQQFTDIVDKTTAQIKVALEKISLALSLLLFSPDCLTPSLFPPPFFSSLLQKTDSQEVPHPLLLRTPWPGKFQENLNIYHGALFKGLHPSSSFTGASRGARFDNFTSEQPRIMTLV